MNKKLVVFLLLVCGAVGLSFTPPAERYFEIAKNLDVFASLFKEVNALYVDEINPNKTIRTGIDAMLASLDPYTNFISEDEVEDFRTLNTGQYGGIGAVTRVFNNRTVVTMVHENYPAFKNGLKIGDEVIKMNGIELSTLTLEEANHLMRGQVGTPVKLTVKRMGKEKPFDIEFKREKIKISNVPYFGMVSSDVGYVQLTEFTPDAGKEVKNAVVSLKEKGAKHLILDLRGNPGGLLMESVNICNIFIPKGKKVVDTKGKVENSNVTYETLNSPIDLDIPLVVLINRGSASASEIVAGTLQDYDRAVILGERSYGKGLVQIPRPLSYNSQVKITTAKYYTPTGRCIQVLDYSHRREDGSVGSIPDSLKKEFLTSRGRKVFDGGGIEPDISLEVEDAAIISQILYGNGFIFDYATLYAFNHAAISDAKTFSLTNQEYAEFENWMKTKSYSTQSPIEAELVDLTNEAMREKYYEDLKPQLDQIKTRLADSKKTELSRHKDQIKKLLEREIVSRYYFEKGTVETGFKYDQEVKAGIDILHNQTEYKKILKL
ncbi:MAG: S41 family peptidase [Cyclobacteriaceae bacterium]|nr:S41 family peptidase [Cyclobacteriaceae bacterium]